ncbi:LytTR family DNA-binding domain-containing protein [Pelomonas sp. CA6]|uniref:LytR/AlgR family response regulator transcription factor n=1 Tax=Pelomonas sp. CA6 TaxID=2907999 RepID=UPI001F4BEC50|nr:LytTR family DNA-binding domain-containing protein [Pelomonas sp. CA6]MCH7344395.1 LytTR family DNA-binding domain-containing protein [Pelomonas sp. CA6]
MTRSSIKIVIAEDDPVQRDALCAWIGEVMPAWSIVATTTTPEETLDALENWAPDLALIDIHLQGSPSSDWIQRIPADLPVIYVTGDPDFAIHAFDRAAIDYLLKPVTMRRLRTALERAASDPRLHRPLITPPPDPAAAAAQLAADSRWLAVSRGQELLVVPSADVIYLVAEEKYTRVISVRGEGLVRSGINELRQKLSDQRMAKIHRSIVVNMKYVNSIQRDELGHINVHLLGRTDVLRVSRMYKDAFREFFDGM